MDQVTYLKFLYQRKSKKKEVWLKQHETTAVYLLHPNHFSPLPFFILRFLISILSFPPLFVTLCFFFASILFKHFFLHYNSVRPETLTTHNDNTIPIQMFVVVCNLWLIHSYILCIWNAISLEIYDNHSRNSSFFLFLVWLFFTTSYTHILIICNFMLF